MISCQTNLRFYCLLTNIISNSLLTKWLIFSCLLTRAIPHDTLEFVNYKSITILKGTSTPTKSLLQITRKNFSLINFV